MGNITSDRKKIYTSWMRLSNSSGPVVPRSSGSGNCLQQDYVFWGLYSWHPWHGWSRDKQIVLMASKRAVELWIQSAFAVTFKHEINLRIGSFERLTFSLHHRWLIEDLCLRQQMLRYGARRRWWFLCWRLTTRQLSFLSSTTICRYKSSVSAKPSFRQGTLRSRKKSQKRWFFLHWFRHKYQTNLTIKYP